MSIVVPRRSVSATLAVLLSAAFLLPDAMVAADSIIFRDVASQSRQFMEWSKTIVLTSQQEAVKKAALSAIPAPCCSDNSAYTCCCPCNMARTIWGLSNYMIAREGADAKSVNKKVREWIGYVYPKGYSGRACYSGGCGRRFRDDRCGGMEMSNPVF